MGRVIREYEPKITVSVLKGAWSRETYKSVEDTDRALRELETLIKRHVVPHWDGHIELDVDYGGQEVCEHCGAEWTEDQSFYNGGCCEADEAANEASAT